jgi:hypothetical protein
VDQGKHEGSEITEKGEEISYFKLMHGLLLI